ncbi:MAG TPA: PRC-barrel domain-containing protein [Streptosporangiaceae bacterium]
MAQTAEFVIGADASCTDGPCGQVTRVVVNPIAQTVTHLVVEPKHRQGLGRLVPLDLVSGPATTAAQVRLNCTQEEFHRLDSAEETQFIPGTAGYAEYGPDQVLAWPYYSLGQVGPAPALETPGVSQTITLDTIPAGELAVRRGDRVHATDGAIGHVQGLVIDPASHQVTHVLLAEGHLWGHKEVAIPISAVVPAKSALQAESDDGIRLNIAKDQVKDLPAVDIKHPNG